MLIIFDDVLHIFDDLLIIFDDLLIIFDDVLIMFGDLLIIFDDVLIFRPGFGCIEPASDLVHPTQLKYLQENFSRSRKTCDADIQTYAELVVAINTDWEILRKYEWVTFWTPS